ncbi:MAG: type II secretion system protein GspD [Planctomycetota bacterium]
MKSYFKKFSRTKMIILTLIILSTLFISGCGDFFAQKPTEIQSAAIIRELGGIDDTPDPNVPKPAVYKAPPKIMEQVVGGEVEYKLVYFCKYHRSDELKTLIHEQFATKLFDKKGKETQINDYTVTSSSATNQLIIRCPLRNDIDAVLEVLMMADIPPVQVKVDCIVSELYADKTMDWETTVLIENLFGENIFLGGKLDSDGGVLPAFPGAALRDPARSLFGLSSGYLDMGKPGHRVAVLVDMLESKGYLKILMNPTLEILNGQTAIVSSREHLPIQETFIRSTDSDFFETRTEYYDVIDSLQITPHVFADGYIGLETEIVMGARSIPEGVKQVPVVTERRITNKENRIREGQSLMIGGIRKTEERSVVRGVPFLKDIPLLNTIFSSKDSEERAVETLFILTPTISSGGMPKQQMMENVQKRRASPQMESGWDEVFKDPLGYNAYTDHVEKQAADAEYERFKAELDKAAAQEEVDKVKSELLKAAEQVITEKAKATRAQINARKAQEEAEEAKKAFIEAQKESSETKDTVEQVLVSPEEKAAKKPAEQKDKAEAEGK